MATYAENVWYLDIAGTDVSAYVTRISLEPSIDTVETSAGSGVDHRTRVVGLKDHTLSFDIIHSDSAAYALTLLALAAKTITYGIEGNASGKPKHVQSFILDGVPHETNVEKGLVSYGVSCTAAAAPSTDMFAGGVWA